MFKYSFIGGMVKELGNHTLFYTLGTFKVMSVLRTEDNPNS